MSKIRHSLIEEFIFSYRITGQLLLKFLQAQLEKERQVHFSGYIVLKVIKDNEPLTQRAIANTLGHSEAAISRQVSLLQESGLISISDDPQNLRASKVSLTPSGRKLIHSLNQKSVDNLAALLVEMSDEEIQEVVKINKKMQEIINKQISKETNVN